MLKTNHKMRVQGINQTNQVATGRRGLMRKLDSVMHRCTSLFGGSSRRSTLPFSLENLEGRQMLAADVVLTPGQWTNFDTANADAYDATDGVVILGSGTSGITGITIQTLTDGGAVDTAVLNITVQTDATADAVVLQLATNKQFGSINLVGLNAATTAVTLYIGSGITTTTGATDGRQEATVDGVLFGASTWVNSVSNMNTTMAETYTGDATGGIIGTVAPAAGYAATGTGIVFGSTSVSSMPIDLHIVTGATGTLGSVTASDTDMSLVGPSYVSVGAAGQVTIAGAVAPGASDIKFFINDDAGTGLEGLDFGSVNVAGAGDLRVQTEGIGAGGILLDNGPIVVSAAGEIYIDSDFSNDNDTVAGLVNLKGVTITGDGGFTLLGGGSATGFTGTVSTSNLILSGAGDFLINTQDNGSYAAALTVGTVTITGNNGSTVNILAAGNGAFGAGLTVGDISISGNNAANDVNIGVATNNVTGGVTLGAITNGGLDDDSDVNVLLGDITGALVTGNINLTAAAATNQGDIVITTGDIGGGVTLGAVTMGDVNAGEADTGRFDFQADKVTGATKIGAVTLNSTDGSADFNVTYTDAASSGSLTVGTITADGKSDQHNDFSFVTAGLLSGVTVGNIDLNKGDTGGASAVTISAADASGVILFGDISTGSIVSAQSVNVDLNTDAAVDTNADSLTIGNVSTSNSAATTKADVNFNIDGVNGATKIGTVTLGDQNQADSTSFTLTINGDGKSVTIGAVSLPSTSDGADLTVSLLGATSSGALDIASITATGTGDQNGDVTFSTAGALTSLTLGAVALNDAGAGQSDVSITADTIGPVTITGVWTLAGNGSVDINATDALGSIGDILGAAWDINFGATAGVIAFNSADGVGAVTIRSVDHIDPSTGGIQISANTDGAGEDGTAGFTRIGSVGEINITTQGDDTTNDVAFGDNSFVNALDGADVNIVGAANGTFTAETLESTGLTNTGGSGNWGNFTLTGDETGFNESVSDGLTIIAEDGIGNVIVTGIDSQLINVDFRANRQTSGAPEIGAGNVVGTLGDVTVSGKGGSDSLTGSFRGATIGNFTLSNGDLSIYARTGFGIDNATTADYTNGTIGNILVTTNGGASAGGSIYNTTLRANDGIGTITAQNLAPINGSIDLVLVESDIDGTAAVATDAGNDNGYGGTLGAITADGAITIGSLSTHENGDDTFRASQNAGDITAGSDISVTGLVDVGGDLLQILVIETPSTSGARSITLAGGLMVNGNVDRIATSLGAGDDITINNASSTIGGDLDIITAGIGNTTIDGLRVITGTSGSPVVMVVDDSVDYLVDVTGTWGTGVNAPSMDLTLVFGGSNSVAINDLEGSTSAADGASGTQIQILTRADVLGTNTLATYATSIPIDDSNAQFNLAGLQDDYDKGVTQDGRHDLQKILVEGDLTSNIGFDANPFDGTALTLSGVAPIMGILHNVEIQGEWFNSSASIFAIQVDELSFGSLEVDRIAAQAGNQFSYDSVGAQGGDGVVPNAGNANGTTEDLEVYTALTPITATDVIIPISDGGSITKFFVGPTGTIEFIRFTDETFDGIIDTAVISFDSGMITNISLFGQDIGVEYNAADPANPATDSNTTINYGSDRGGVLATTYVDTGLGRFNVIDYLQFSSQLGAITVNDTTEGDGLATNLGDLLIGFEVILNSGTGLGTTVNGIDHSGTVSPNQFFNSYINDNGDGAPNGFLGLTIAGTGALAVPVHAGTGAVSVDGSLGRLITSGDVESITTIDTETATDALTDGVPDADFFGLIADGSVGPITIDGSVTRGLIVGDQTTLSLGADFALGGGDDVVGINGAPGFTGAINVEGNLGSFAGSFSHATTTDPTDPTVNQPGNIGGLASDEVSAPDGVDVNITVGEILFAGVMSGKRAQLYTVVGATLVPTAADVISDPLGQENDSITGNISASEIFGDIWSGNDLNGTITARGDGQFYSPTSTSGAFGPDANRYGSIRDYTPGLSNNSTLDITASGGSPGDITGAITAAGNINNIFIDAGTGSGGSLLANVIAGLSGVGGFTGNNRIHADNSIGAGNAFVVSSADSQVWDEVFSGLENDLVAFGGDIDSDFIAGLAIGATGPVVTNLQDSTLVNFQNEDDTIEIDDLEAGWSQDGVNQDGNTSNDQDSNLTATFTAAGHVSIFTFLIDGNAIGNNGAAGGHIVAATLGYKDGGFGDFGNLSQIGTTSGSVIGVLSGTFSAGMFVPADTGANSPLNPADLGPMAAGTVLTLGSLEIDLNVGVWDQSATGTNGSNGIELGELLTGNESGTGGNPAFAPAFSVGATENIDLDIFVLGRPTLVPGEAESNAATATGGIASDGDATDVSIAAFGAVSGDVTATDTVSFTFVMSNIDAIIARDSNNANPTTPSNISLFLPLNSGQGGNVGDNSLNITSQGFGAGGLDIEFDTAGYDYFAQLGGGTFFGSFGLGDLEGDLIAQDQTPSAGLDVGILSFAFAGAGEDVSSDLIAQDNIVTRLSSASTDGGALFPNSHDADVVAGLSANALNPTGGATLFPGGDVSGRVLAGGAIGTLAHPLAIAALGTALDVTGNFTSDFRLVSGAEDQVGDPVTASDIHAIVIASGGVAGQIDAGDTQQSFGDDTSGGLGGQSGVINGAFFGAIHAGAGNDLNIFNTDDNQVNANIAASIRTTGNLDVSGTLANHDNGIYSENNISGVIEAGYAIAGGNLIGDVVAEGNIAEIEVFGNVGPGLVYAGGLITNLAVGNATGWAANFPGSVMYTHTASEYTSTFGTITADIYEGNKDASGANVAIFIGQSLDAGATLLVGLDRGVTGTFTLEQNANQVILAPASGARMVINQTGPTNPDVYLYNVGGASVGLTVTGVGQAAAIDTLVALDTLSSLVLNNATVASIIVDDQFDVNSALISNGSNTAALQQFTVALGTFPFLTESLPAIRGITTAVNNGIASISGPITSTGDIGDITVQGNLGGDITSTGGSIGNVTVGGTILSNVDFNGFTGIGNIYAGTGGIDGDNSFTSATGGVGVISVQDDISAPVFDIQTSIGGLIARTGLLNTGTINVHDSIGLLQASGNISGNLTTETGTIGIDLDLADEFTTVDGNGIYSDSGNISITLTAGGTIGSANAFKGTLSGTYNAGGSIGNLTSGGNLSGTFTAQRGSIGNLLSVAGNVTPTLTAGTSVGNITSSLGAVNVTLHAGTGPVGNVTASNSINGSYEIETGSIGNFLSSIGDVDVNVSAGGSVGNLTATTGGVFSNIVAGGSVGNVTAGGSDGDDEAIDSDITAQDGSIGNLRAITGSIDGTYIAGNKVGTISADVGDILENIRVTAGGGEDISTADIGNITAGGDIQGGVFTALRGWIGNLHALTGSIGNFDTTVLVANGGVSIDPDTLQWTAAPATGRRGVGTVFADLGDISVDITTGGDVGTDPDITSAVRGGIAAPLGFVYAALKVGGNLGGVSGQDVYLPSDNVVLGSTFTRNQTPGTWTVQGVNVNNPLIISTTDDANNAVDYRVIVSAGTAEVIYTVNDDSTVTINSITYNATGDSASIQVLTTTGGRTAGTFVLTSANDSAALVEVEDMVVNGNVQSIRVDGALDSLTVNGNLAGGTLNVDSLGNAYVAGNIGTSVLNEVVQVKSGEFGSLTAGGTNFGLRTVTIDSDNGTSNTSFESFANTLNHDSVASTPDDFINVYIGKGSAVLSINNGYVQGISLNGTSATNLYVYASSTADHLTSNPSSNTVKGIATSQVTTGANSAAVGNITALGSKFNLKGLIVEGDLGSANLGGNIASVTISGNIDNAVNVTGTAKDIVVKGNVNQLFVAKGITNLTVVGSAGLVDGGLSINNATIGNGVDILKATSNVANVRVSGNAGVLSSGQAMTNVFVTGSSINVTAGAMTNVQITGSVGASISTGTSSVTGDVVGQVGLGSAFSISQIAYLVLGNANASLAQLSVIGNTGALNDEVIIIPGTNTGDGPGGNPDENNTIAYPAETLFYGGLHARKANNVVVGGGISDLLIQSAQDNALLNNVQDDAVLHVGKRLFGKLNGVIVVAPDTHA